MDKMTESAAVFYATLRGNQHKVEVVKQKDFYEIRIDGKPYIVDVRFLDSPNTLSLLINQRCYEVTVHNSGRIIHVSIGGEEFELELASLREQRGRRADSMTVLTHKEIKAPMPGIVVSVEVKEEDIVDAGQPLVIIEAMKMQNEIGSPGKAKVRKVHVHAGDAVDSKQTLVTLDLL